MFYHQLFSINIQQPSEASYVGSSGLLLLLLCSLNMASHHPLKRAKYCSLPGLIPVPSDNHQTAVILILVTYIKRNSIIVIHKPTSPELLLREIVDRDDDDDDAFQDEKPITPAAVILRLFFPSTICCCSCHCLDLLEYNFCYCCCPLHQLSTTSSSLFDKLIVFRYSLSIR